MFVKTQYSDGEKEWKNFKKQVEKNKISDIFCVALMAEGERFSHIMVHGATPTIQGLLRNWLDNFERETLVRRQMEESFTLHQKIWERKDA